MSYTTFKNKWLGKRTNIDGINGYQCVDLVKQYLSDEYGIPGGAWGNAKDYWLNTPAAILAKFNKSASPQVGGLVVFKGINGNPYGHIGLVDKIPSGGMVPTLEQNGSTGSGNGLAGNAIRVRSITTSRVYGYLNPKSAPKPSLPMPSVGGVVKNSVARTLYKRNSGQVLGSVSAPSAYKVLGYDSDGRSVWVRSAKYGDARLALYYVGGARIEGTTW